jgi:hypothetical protein
MRTSVDLNDRLLAQAKAAAAARGITLRELFEQALRSFLEVKRKKSGYKLRWRSERGRLQPGVRLDDRDALFDLMDGR